MFWIVVSLTLCGQYLKRKFQNTINSKKKVNALYEEVINKLKKNKVFNNDQPYLSVVQLRDTLLADEVNLVKRNKIWNKVIRKIESDNTNVTSKLLEVHGEIMKCLEWIGPVDESG